MLSLTTDNATSNGTFIDCLVELTKDGPNPFDRDMWIRCFAHVLNICVQKILEVICILLQKVKHENLSEIFVLQLELMDFFYSFAISSTLSELRRKVSRSLKEYWKDWTMNQILFWISWFLIFSIKMERKRMIWKCFLRIKALLKSSTTAKWEHPVTLLARVAYTISEFKQGLKSNHFKSWTVDDGEIKKKKLAFKEIGSESFPLLIDQFRSSVVAVLRVEQRQVGPTGPVSAASFETEQNFQDPFHALQALWAAAER